MEATKKLTNLQIELLKLFQYNLPDTQLAEIKNMLAKYFAKTATAKWTNYGRKTIGTIRP